jgi:hypothetical protein
MKYKHLGQSTMGYTVATAVLMMALFTPWDGQSSIMVQFLEAVRELHANSTYVLSLP